MTPIQHAKTEGIAIGEAKGLKKVREEIAAKLLRTQQMSLQAIADLTSLSVDELKVLQNNVFA